MWFGIELYSNVGMCLQLNCFPLLSLIFYLLFESIPQFIEGSLNMVKLFIINTVIYMLMLSVPLFS